MAAQYWADKQTETDNYPYAVPGLLASLWTPETSDNTLLTLMSAKFLPTSTWGTWAKNPLKYEIGSKTVSNSVWHGLQLEKLSAVERANVLLKEKGLMYALSISKGPWRQTINKNATPGGIIGLAVGYKFLEHIVENTYDNNINCGCK